MNLRRGATAALLVLGALAPGAFALGPADVWILVNKNVADSQAVADHYCDKRGVPKDHVVALDLPTGEDIGRADYDAKLAGPLREQLKDKKDKVKVLLTVYGVPLRVGSQQPNEEEKAELDKLKNEMEPLEKRRKELDDEIKALETKVKDDPKGQAADDLKARRQDRADLENKLQPLEAGAASCPTTRARRRWTANWRCCGMSLTTCAAGSSIPFISRFPSPPSQPSPRGWGREGGGAVADDVPAGRAERGAGQAHHRPVGGGRGEGFGGQSLRGRPRHPLQPGRRAGFRLRRLR